MDPVTGRPNEEKRGRNAEEAEAEHLKRLEAKAALAGFTETSEGKIFVDLVRERFTTRVEALAMADPEASVLLSLLNEMGLKERQAASAAEELAGRRFLKRT
ncbi:MAG: hypothetical protein HZB23_10755 [Deltaproteobacteria bacterium]|nr:hypothetical protein [Deltaproteobacteria bacterium]